MPTEASVPREAIGDAIGIGERQGARAEWKANWRVVLAAAVGISTGMLLYNFVSSVFIEHYEAEFGWSRGQIALGNVGLLIGALSAPLVGRQVDRVGVRRVLFMVTIGYALVCVGMAVQTGSLVLYYSLCLLLALVGVATGGLSWTRVISASFNLSRGLAISAGISAVSITAAIVPSILYILIDATSWRVGWLFVGGLCLICGMAALAILPPAATAAPRQAAPSAGLREAAGTADYWWLFGGMVLVNIPAGGILTQLAALISDKKVSSGDVALVMSLFAVAVFCGRFLAGFAVDRFAAQRVACAMALVPAAGCLLLLGDAPPVAIIMVGIFLIGINQGADGDIAPYIVSKRFGMSAFSQIVGSIYASFAVGTAMGAGLFGFVHDRFGSYDIGLMIGVGAFSAGALMFLRIGGFPDDAGAR